MEKRITEGHYVPSGFQHETYHCSVCNFQGSTATWKAHDGEEGFWCYVCRQKEVPVKSALKMVMVDSLKWVRTKVEVKCCGEWLDCDRQSKRYVVGVLWAVVLAAMSGAMTLWSEVAWTVGIVTVLIVLIWVAKKISDDAAKSML